MSCERHDDHACPMFDSSRADRLEDKIDKLLDEQIAHGKAIVEIKRTTDFYLGNGKDGKVVEDIKALRSDLTNMQNGCKYKHEDVDQRFLAVKQQMEAPAKTVSTWTERLKGAGAIIGLLATGSLGSMLLRFVFHWGAK